LLPEPASFRDHASRFAARGSFVVDADAGVVAVELVGACVSCPASTVTLKAGIERILKDRVDGVTEVVDVGTPSETSVGLGL
jgi:Fe-S cluster biogenesis protein NfuA